MKAVILAAGQGTRLKRYTENLPKGMLSFLGKTLIERQVELYRACGINDIIIVCGYAKDKISYKGVKYYTNEEYKDTNMVVSLLAAKEEFDDDIIISYSDILFQKSMLEEMMRRKEDFSVAVDKEWKDYWNLRYGTIYFDTESLKIDQNDQIISLGASDPPMEEIDARYIGLLKFSKKGLLDIIKLWDKNYELYLDRPWQQSGKTIKKAYMTDLLNALIADGKEIQAVKFVNGWIEFDTNEDYEKACEWAENGMINKILKFIKH